MFLFANTILLKVNGGTGFYILAYLPLAALVVFAIAFVWRKKK